MKSKTLRWVVLLGLGPILFGKTSRSETISHGVPTVPPDPGNTIPQGSQAICPGVPDGVALIPGLRTGRALAQSSFATVPQPPPGSVVLLFSDQPLACQDLGVWGIDKIVRDSEIAQGGCVSAWSFSILLPPEMQMPGVYTLADHQTGFENSIAMGETQETSTTGGCGGGPGGPGRPACASSGASLGGGGGPQGPPGTVEIYSVTDQCITGRFQGLMTGQIQPPPPDFNGAFHAVRCTP
jgi:hypothetical protein